MDFKWYLPGSSRGDMVVRNNEPQQQTQIYVSFFLLYEIIRAYYINIALYNLGNHFQVMERVPSRPFRLTLLSSKKKERYSFYSCYLQNQAAKRHDDYRYC